MLMFVKTSGCPLHNENRLGGLKILGWFGSVRFFKTVSDPSDSLPHTPIQLTTSDASTEMFTTQRTPFT